MGRGTKWDVGRNGTWDEMGRSWDVGRNGTRAEKNFFGDNRKSTPEISGQQIVNPFQSQL